ncbi:hypothetical protein [Microcoleus sp. Pol11C3]
MKGIFLLVNADLEGANLEGLICGWVIGKVLI